MPTAQVNGVRLNYLLLDDQTAGSSDCLVMVHGLATSMAFWYMHYAQTFARHFRVLLYDLRGHGRSERPASGYRPSDLADDLSALLDHLDIAGAHVLAHSFGGVVAMNLAVREPERVASLVLADTHISAARHIKTGKEWLYGRMMQSVLDRYGVELDTRDPYFGYRLLTRIARMAVEGFVVPHALRELVGPLMGRQGLRTAAHWLLLMKETSAEAELMGDDGLTLDRLRRFEFPILAIYGDRSQAQLTGTELLEVWSHAKFRRIRGAGHFFPLSRPAEVISCCTRFWAGEFNDERPHRAGEEEKRYFRSDRIFEEQGAWYFLARGADRVGPFAGADEARASLQQYIEAVAPTEKVRY